jgi:hypothetical protein
MDLDLTSDSDMEAAILDDILPKPRQQRQFKKRSFGEAVDEVMRKQQHRVPLEVVNYLEDVLTPLLQHPTNRNQPLSPRQQVKIFASL